MSRYVPSRRLYWIGLAFYGVAALCAWLSFRWAPAAAFALALLAFGSVILYLSLLPPIEIRAEYLRVGSRVIPWNKIRRVDRLYCRRPLIVRLKLADGRTRIVIYPGDLESSSSLLRHIRRHARLALIEGRPYREFWGEISAPSGKKAEEKPRYRLLRPEDEEEIERLYHQLRTAGRIDNKNPGEET